MTKHAVKNFLPAWVLYCYWLVRVLRMKIIKWIPQYDEDELITSHSCDFINEERFRRCYDEAVRAGLYVSPTIRWRAHVACWAAMRGKDLDGDFVECGVNKGFLSKIVMSYIGFEGLSKKFWLLDTFEGFVDEYLTQSEREKHPNLRASYEPCYEKACHTFGHMENVKIVRGAVPDTLSQVTSERIAYLSIDMNCVRPEIAAAEFFWPRLVPGATMLLDDYGHAGHEAQKEAFDQFSVRYGVPILSLPTGQGMIVKP